MTASDREPAQPEPEPAANYLDLYGLSTAPFDGTSRGAGYILFGSHRRAFELLVDHLLKGSGLVVLQGEEGIGKTEALHSAATVAAEAGLTAVMVSRPANGRINLMQLIMALRGQPKATNTTNDDVITHFLAPPRKVLLVDDVDLMPAECVSLLLSLAQLIPEAPDAPAMVLSSSTALTAEPERPELSQLAALARNTVRLLPLGPAEIRQYIERSLWIAGGTTRRLIAADAMKVLIARSGGVPGMTNRVMQAALTAGFARGDSMITAKTVAAATGPTKPRPPPHPSAAAGVANSAIQLVAIGLLVVGASVFLFKGLNGRFDRPIPAAPAVSTSVPAPPIAPKAPEQSPVARSDKLPPELLAALMKRGDQSVDLGDIAAARLLYRRAADAGNGQAATALGKTFDPNYAASGQTPDAAQAARWYQAAISLGDTHATELLKRLGK